MVLTPWRILDSGYVRRVCVQSCKWSEWWNKAVSVEAVEVLLRNGSKEEMGINTYDRYRVQRAIVKQAFEVSRRMADWRWGERLGNEIEGNKKMSWKEVKLVRKSEQARDDIVNEVNGQILRDAVEVRRRWTEHFEQVLNVEDVRKANINVVGDWQMPVLGELNERAIFARGSK